MSKTLVEFMTERLDEREAIAKAAAEHGAEWRIYSPYDCIQDIVVHELIEDKFGPRYITIDHEGIMPSVDEDAAPHIAFNDPARILADIEAQREIVTSYDQITRHVNDDVSYLYMAIECLAAPYRDHPDYDESWAV